MTCYFLKDYTDLSVFTSVESMSALSADRPTNHYKESVHGTHHTR